ncbi:MFS transporter [Couchioplanes caeruleus]|uniref:MFS transporter n=1 Tax=Couchioplanes caeruleus TaxID=56438 RepID=A0A3N1GME4_9ACTN|nr:MFS transporter [Couchioplanes caeruleus]ROP31351.1 MFS transporter [Couchioplanes caeruleus]
MVKVARLPSGALRWLYLATFLTATGGGGWFVCWTIFATTSIGLSAWQFGAGVTVAGIVGLSASVPLGYLADRVGVNKVLALLLVVQGVTLAGYALVDSLWSFILVSCFFVMAERSVPAMRIALVCGLTDDDDRMHHLASLRVTQSGGAALGAGVGTLVLYLNTRPAFLALLFLYGALTLISAAVVQRLPAVPSLRDRGEKRKAMVVSDRPFLVATVLFGILALNWGMLAVGVPLWVVHHTDAPTWTVGVMLALNTVGILLFQKRVGASSATLDGAARNAVLCVIPLTASCLLFAASAGGSGVTAAMILIAAAAVHTVGELMFVASSWGVAVGLTPQEAHGEYQSVFNSGFTIAEMAAPLVMSALVVSVGAGGWLVLAALFIAGGVPMRTVSNWARRHPLRTAASPIPQTSEQT